MDLNQDTVERLRHRLTERREVLWAKLQQDRERQSSETMAEIGGEVRDPGDESVAAERTDLGNAMLGRDVGEFREVEGALARIAEGVYGICIACGVEIEEARLEAYPSVKRCSRCQQVLERQYANGGGTAF
jgi:DnaK suppressor protein